MSYSYLASLAAKAYAAASTVALAYKLEVLAAVGLVAAVVLASPFDRFLVVAYSAIAFALGYKLGSAIADVGTPKSS